ncbi:hypothetical protein ASZ90_019449 [hydrocarbon metagenome]|uniref:Uncharacterized protein n=1 Tax=hydrocarbon metagenome TaxID=938273 RepID=A0A0W8E3E0_9ZZZZ
MYNYKKRFLLILLVALFTLSITVSAIGKECNDDNKVGVIVFTAEEITDQNILYQRAINNISDTGKSSATEAVLVSPDGSSDLIDTYQTTQLLKSEVYSNGSSKNTYVTNSFATIKLDSRGFAGSDDVTKHKWDQYDYVRAQSTIYFNIFEDDNSTNYYDLVQVAGRWDKYNSPVSLSNRSCAMHAMGNNYYGGGGENYYAFYNLSADNWIKLAPVAWDPVDPTLDGEVGALTKVTITHLMHPESSWQLLLSNSLS